MIPIKNRVARPALTACLVLTLVAAGARPAMAGQSVEDRLAVLSDQVAQLSAALSAAGAGDKKPEAAAVPAVPAKIVKRNGKDAAVAA